MTDFRIAHKIKTMKLIMTELKCNYKWIKPRSATEMLSRSRAAVTQPTNETLLLYFISAAVRKCFIFAKIPYFLMKITFAGKNYRPAVAG